MSSQFIAIGNTLSEIQVIRITFYKFIWLISSHAKTMLSKLIYMIKSIRFIEKYKYTHAWVSVTYLVQSKHSIYLAIATKTILSLQKKQSSAKYILPNLSYLYSNATQNKSIIHSLSNPFSNKVISRTTPFSLFI